MAGDKLTEALPPDLPDLPDCWEWKPLLDYVLAGRGISYGIVQPGDHDPNGVPILRAENVQNSRVELRDVMRVSPSIESRYKRTRLSGGEVLITLVGAHFGKVAVAPKSAAGYNTARAVGVVPVQSDELFLSHALQSPVCQRYIQTWATTTAQPTLNLGDVRRIPIPSPPSKTRDAIAAVLGALDDKIELNRRMNATLEAMARALFQSWFVDFDPVHAKRAGRKPPGMDAATAALFPDSFQDSELGRIPKGWEAISLYDTAQWVNGAAFKNEDFCAAGEGLPVIKIAELKDGIGAQTKWSLRDADPDRIVDTGDLLYSWSGSPDTSLEAFLWSGGRGLLNQHIFKVIAPTAAQKRFVYYLLQYLRPVLVETARNKQTTGLGHVTIADMKCLQVCGPSEAVLAAFDRNITPVFDKAFANTLESRALATLRDTLLPKLLGGELRVPTATLLVETHT